jgi:hypothetical protein
MTKQIGTKVTINGSIRIIGYSIFGWVLLILGIMLWRKLHEKKWIWFIMFRKKKALCLYMLWFICIITQIGRDQIYSKDGYWPNIFAYYLLASNVSYCFLYYMYKIICILKEYVLFLGE